METKAVGADAAVDLVVVDLLMVQEKTLLGARKGKKEIYFCIFGWRVATVDSHYKHQYEVYLISSASSDDCYYALFIIIIEMYPGWMVC